MHGPTGLGHGTADDGNRCAAVVQQRLGYRPQQPVEGRSATCTHDDQGRLLRFPGHYRSRVTIQDAQSRVDAGRKRTRGDHPLKRVRAVPGFEDMHDKQPVPPLCGRVEREVENRLRRSRAVHPDQDRTFRGRPRPGDHDTAEGARGELHGHRFPRHAGQVVQVPVADDRERRVPGQVQQAGSADGPPPFRW